MTRSLVATLEAVPELAGVVQRHLAELDQVAKAFGELELSTPPSRRELLTAPADDLSEAQFRAEERAAQSLTKTEEDVASLAAQGLTNAEIGKGLHMSANTVKTHLTRVFAKLGVSSRRELTRRVTRDQR